MKIACYTDMHNMQTMLNLPTTLRQSAVKAVDLTCEEWGQADLCVCGGDTVSDYPYWNRSCALPYKNWLDIKGKVVDNFARGAKDGRVLYVDGNNDLILGDLPTAENPPYNTCDYYYSGPMKDTLGVLEETEYIAKYCASKGEQAGLHLLCFHYVVDGVDFFGVNLDPDTAFNSHDGFYSYEALAWLKKKLAEVDPDGVKPIFVVGHLSATVWMDSQKLREDMDEQQRAAFYDALTGHANLFYLYGHVHCPHFKHAFSSDGVLHFDGQGNPTVPGETAEFCGEAAFHTVHMGSLRPHAEWVNGEEIWFEKDIVEGTIPLQENPNLAPTGTPKLAQYLLVELLEDRVIFSYRNTGTVEGYTAADKPAPYTVWLKK